MSRICVKNTPHSANEKQLRELFGSKGEVTDVRIVRTKAGKSRQLAFVGFRTEAQAQEAIRYFNNTFIETSRVTVESAKKVGDATLLETARSRHTKKKLEKANKAREKEAEKEKEAAAASAAAAAKAKKPAAPAMTKEKRDFLEAMKAKKDKKLWGNDEAPTAATAAGTEMEMDVGGSGDDDEEEDDDDDADDDDVNDAPVAAATATASASSKQANGKKAPAPTPASAGPQSDLDYLRSKVRAHFSDDEDDEDDDDDGEEESGRKGRPPATAAAAAEAMEEEEEEEEDIEDGDSEDAAADPTSSSSSGAAGTAGAGGEAGEGADEDSGRLFVRNLVFSCSEEELRALFEPFGLLAAVHLPLDAEKKGKGFGFVQFVIPEQAGRARTELDGTPFQGRVLHVIAAKKAPEPAAEDAAAGRGKPAGRLSAFQQKKEEERRAQAGAKDGWNASYVRSDAVVDALAERYGVARGAIMDHADERGGELAVRLAIGEAQVVRENREYFLAHGVDLDALESAHGSSSSSSGSGGGGGAAGGKKASARSDTTLLIKNLPHDVVEEELETMFARFGVLSSLLLPASKSVALVDFVEPSEARAAFKGLAYRRYRHVPLYLEWAPLGTVDKSKAGNKAGAKASSSSSSSSSSVGGSSSGGSGGSAAKDDEGDDYSTLFLKNLSFSTGDEALRAHILKTLGGGTGTGSGGDLRTVTITKKQKGEHWLSMGFGFAEFRTAAAATAALKCLQGSVLDGHSLEVKPSEKRISKGAARGPGASGAAGAAGAAAPKAAKAGAGSNKLIVRNLAFQAAKGELKALFSAFGAVKRVRIPKKMGGVHRGFAFVDFSTAQEAAAAMAALTSAHLYGRHLVLEYAKDDEEDQDLDVLRKRAKVDEGAIKAEKRRRTIGDGAGTSEMGSAGVGHDDI